jgi:hypothetical protein
MLSTVLTSDAGQSLHVGINEVEHGGGTRAQGQKHPTEVPTACCPHKKVCFVPANCTSYASSFLLLLMLLMLLLLLMPMLLLLAASCLLVCLDLLEGQDSHHTLTADAELLCKGRDGPPAGDHEAVFSIARMNHAECWVVSAITTAQ